LTGKPYPARLVFGLFRPRQKIPGMDMAGQVESIGSNVHRFRPGDEVFGEIRGAYAEYVCVVEEKLARKPPGLSFEQAASVPVAAVSALQGLRDSARLQPGHRVLINGASGGVGTFAVQIARALGAEVTGVCHASGVELVRSLGAEHVVDYTREDFSRGSQRYDAILDLVGSASLPACRRLLTPQGVYVSLVGRTGWSLNALLASFWPWGQGRVTLLVTQPRPEDLEFLANLITSGQVKPVVARRFALSEVPEALRMQGLGHARGKSIIVL
jgi:NADPH:quinone reductase-like Zn-dependent oxidoreductase